LILRQDLVDPNNPSNLRSDWPRPSGLPGPGHWKPAQVGSRHHDLRWISAFAV